MNETLPENGIIAVDQVKWVKSQCIDKELLLAWVLGFRYCAVSAGAVHWRSEDFSFRDQLPWYFTMDRGLDSSRPDGWCVPIRPLDRPLIKVLLPPNGPIFSTSDPFRRLYDRAAYGRVWLTQNRIRQTCLSYAQASGHYHKDFLQLGHFGPETYEPHILLPVPSNEARRYWMLTASPETAAKLPRLDTSHR